MDNYYTYMRISTKEEKAKQRFSRQESALKHYATKNNIEYLIEFKEDISGKSFDGRNEWKKLERIVQPGDYIVMKDVCRFTREAENGYNKYMSLMNKGVNLVFLDNPTISTDYIKNLLNIAETQDLIARESTKFIAKILLIAELDRAEKERLVISQRTRDGMAASPNKAGRKVGHLDKMTPALEADIRRYLRDRTIKQVDLLKKYKISRNTLRKYIAYTVKELSTSS